MGLIYQVKQKVFEQVGLISKKMFFKDPIEAKWITSKEYQIFFGYYDIQPFDKKQSKLLALRTRWLNKDPLPETFLDVGYINLDGLENNFVKIGQTTTWCWQQGCRLQWFPGQSGRNIIFNSLTSQNQYGCEVREVDSKKKVAEYTRPVYSLSSDGKWGLSLNFSRLHRLRKGYGYAQLPDETKYESAPENDGIWRINLETGKDELLLSIGKLSRMNPCPSMKGAQHYFNHLLFNPSGTRFMFFHLWQIPQGKRFIQMYTCNCDGTDIHPLNTEGHVSHYNWKNDTELLAYATHSDQGRGYYLYTDKTDKRIMLGPGILRLDGHPSFFNPNVTTFLSDTYPDRFRLQRLFIYNPITDCKENVAVFWLPLAFSKDVRCDLHPRISPCGTKVCVDAVVKNRRALVILDLRKTYENI